MRYYVPYGSSNSFSGFDSLFDDIWGDWSVGSCRVPAVNVYETDGAYVMEAELAGYREKDVHVKVDKHVLTLSSEKTNGEKGKKEKSLIRERCYRAFERSFILPEDTDEQNIEAEFSDGVLTVTMPKQEAVQPKRIEVKIQNNQ